MPNETEIDQTIDISSQSPLGLIHRDHSPLFFCSIFADNCVWILFTTPHWRSLFSTYRYSLVIEETSPWHRQKSQSSLVDHAESKRIVRWGEQNSEEKKKERKRAYSPITRQYSLGCVRREIALAKGRSSWISQLTAACHCCRSL